VQVPAERPTLQHCPICDGAHLDYQFTNNGTAIVRCRRCGLLMRNPQPSDDELAAIYTEEYFLLPAGEADRLKRDTAAAYLDVIDAHPGAEPVRPGARRLLELGSGMGDLLIEARSRGYDVTGVEFSSSSVRAANARLGANCVLQGTLDTVPLADASFDVAVLADVIEHTRDPLRELQRVWRLLGPGGALFIALPSLESWSARLMRERWMEFKLEHLFYFDNATVQTLLVRSGFEQIEISTGWKTLSPEYIIQHFRRFPVPVLSGVAQATGALLPGPVRRHRMKVVASGVNVVARRAVRPPLAERRHRLSVIVPVFNERASFPEVMRGLLAKSIPDVDIEIIVVESNSTDGTREEARKLEGHPRLTVLYQDAPRGKGYAVRAGLAHATGDYILIQDADLEYDLDDYEQLLQPLMTGAAAFVLGSRHDTDGRSWKIRRFTDQRGLGQVMNLGHLFFTGLFNLVYGTRLKDPFTMFKVFRRDCLHGLTFEANRFDFDWELVGKLVRAGYRPLEIPVNYRSRSFAEGKKISFFRDPLTWIRACFKYRFVRLRKRTRRGDTH
jgi:glycosyltransferase involved in cell wall biosynthesis/SAM-dependent methyltransferase